MSRQFAHEISLGFSAGLSSLLGHEATAGSSSLLGHEGSALLPDRSSIQRKILRDLSHGTAETPH